MAAYELIKTVIIISPTFLVFLIPSIKASEIVYISTSNKSLFFPRKQHFSCHLSSLLLKQTVAAIIFL